LTDAVAAQLRHLRGTDVPHDAWDLDRVPGHLRVTYRVEDDTGAVAAEGKDLDALKAQLESTVRSTVARAAADVERSGLTSWTLGDLPPTFERQVDGEVVKGFPALVDEGTSVGLRVLGSAEEQERETWRGTRRLLTLTVPSPVKHVVGRLDNTRRLALGHNPHGSVPALMADCVDCAVDTLMAAHGGPVSRAEAFDRLRAAVRADLPETTYDVVVAVAGILAVAHELRARVDGAAGPALAPALADVRAQLDRLVGPGFVTAAGRDRLPHLHRYLRAAQVRLDALPAGLARDQRRQAEVEAVAREVDTWLRSMSPARRDRDGVREIGWMLEELRVGLFAQRLGTPQAISAQRIYRAMDALGA
jgi:ATP-dependent helicase HrpA